MWWVICGCFHEPLFHWSYVWMREMWWAVVRTSFFGDGRSLVCLWISRLCFDAAWAGLYPSGGCGVIGIVGPVGGNEVRESRVSVWIHTSNSESNYKKMLNRHGFVCNLYWRNLNRNTIFGSIIHLRIAR